MASLNLFWVILLVGTICHGANGQATSNNGTSTPFDFIKKEVDNVLNTITGFTQQFLKTVYVGTQVGAGAATQVNQFNLGARKEIKKTENTVTKTGENIFQTVIDIIQRPATDGSTHLADFLKTLLPNEAKRIDALKQCAENNGIVNIPTDSVMTFTQCARDKIFEAKQIFDNIFGNASVLQDTFVNFPIEVNNCLEPVATGILDNKTGQDYIKCNSKLVSKMATNTFTSVQSLISEATNAYRYVKNFREDIVDCLSNTAEKFASKLIQQGVNSTVCNFENIFSQQ